MAVQTIAVNTLTYDAERCIGCGMCAIVCPHGVFALEGRVAQIVRGEACIECGACERNCPTLAIQVESGPGCAQALIRAAIFGGEPTCGPADGCCGGESSCGDSSCGESAGGCGGDSDAEAGHACCGEGHSQGKERASAKSACCGGGTRCC